MRLIHVALWTDDLERSRDFYVRYFGGKSNRKYENLKKGFASYFVSFEEGPALEIMQRQDISDPVFREHIGLAHLAFHASSNEEVDQWIERFRADGYSILGEPRVSGDGYYEGVIRDPDGNVVEIVAYGEPEIQTCFFPPYELLREAVPDPDSVMDYCRNSDCVIAKLGGQVVGAVVVRQVSRSRAEILSVVVADIFRRRGISRRLLRSVLDHWGPMKGGNLTRLRVRVLASSVIPLLLYQQEGFSIVMGRESIKRDNEEPIWDNGVPCRHRLLLEKLLK